MLRKYDLIIISAPPSFHLMTALMYKVFFKIPIAVDIINLWPEALPMSKKLKAIINPIIQWPIKPLRTWLYSQADIITTQSYYFRRNLNLTESQCHVIPMSSANLKIKSDQLVFTDSIRDQLRLVYLGSINHIIDLASLINLLTQLSQKRSVHLSVIGGGESLDYLKETLSKIDITTTFYGICFDPSIKTKELSQAHFGYNGYVDTTAVALSYKSVEYFAHSLPLLNSTKGDTYEIIDKEKCGLNFKYDAIDELVESILALDDENYQLMRKQTAKVFEQTFSWDVFTKEIKKIYQPFT